MCVPTRASPEGDPYPIRSIRDERYKLILNLMPDKPYYNRFMMTRERKDRNTVWFSWVDIAGKDPHAKEITERFEHRPEVEFYDTSKDPSELHNLANDPAYTGKITELKKQLTAWMEQQGDKGAEIDKVYAKKP